ncbi:MAG: type II toxin-antitoxin system RelB/DinJ family antitoxin [Coriobacteriia bacterium]|nr:type II toxin-antitoxin system RelB/DinJ family antitoxin [Coriobacteriia bacterium]
MQTATINVRINQSLKQQGDAVFERQGITISEIVRALYQYAASEQRLPDFIQGAEEEKAEQRLRRLQLLNEMTGVISDKTTALADIRWERLQRQIRPGT